LKLTGEAHARYVDSRCQDLGRPARSRRPQGRRHREHRRLVAAHRFALDEGSASPPLHTQTIIAELRYVVDRLADFYTPEETRLCLHASHPLLNNERVIDLISSGRTEEVLAVIERLDAGAYL
jgi:hypothetical protein